MGTLLGHIGDIVIRNIIGSHWGHYWVTLGDIIIRNIIGSHWGHYY